MAVYVRQKNNAWGKLACKAIGAVFFGALAHFAAMTGYVTFDSALLYMLALLWLSDSVERHEEKCEARCI